MFVVLLFRYFGPSARQSFFAQTNYLSKQRSMTTLNTHLPTLIYKSDISIADEVNIVAIHTFCSCIIPNLLTYFVHLLISCCLPCDN